MSQWRHQPDPRIDYDRDNDPPDDPDGHLAFNIARVCAEAAARGGHPEAAPQLERELCAAAGLPEPAPERDRNQPDLFV